MVYFDGFAGRKDGHGLGDWSGSPFLSFALFQLRRQHNQTKPSGCRASRRQRRSQVLRGQDGKSFGETCRRGYLLFALHWQCVDCLLARVPGLGVWAPGDRRLTTLPARLSRSLGGQSVNVVFTVAELHASFSVLRWPAASATGSGCGRLGATRRGRWSKRRHVSYRRPAPHREPPPLPPTTPAGLAPPPSWGTPDGSASIHETSETVPLRRSCETGSLIFMRRSQATSLDPPLSSLSLLPTHQPVYCSAEGICFPYSFLFHL